MPARSGPRSSGGRAAQGQEWVCRSRKVVAGRERAVMIELNNTPETIRSEDLEVLSVVECLALLSTSPVGRIAVVVDGQPLVFPVNFRLIARHSEEPVIVVRARPDGVVAHSGAKCAFQRDGIDDLTHAAWSVLVQGILQAFDPVDLDSTRGWLDPVPWADAEARTQWLMIVPTMITGRRLGAHSGEWAFSIHAYL